MASEAVGESAAKEEEGGGGGGGGRHSENHYGVVIEDPKLAGLDSASQSSLSSEEPRVVLTNGIEKGDIQVEFGSDTGRLSAADVTESVLKRERSLSRQNSDRGGGGGGGGGVGGNKEKAVTVEGKTGELKQDENDIEVSYY